jgi:hypothetical protein
MEEQEMYHKKVKVKQSKDINYGEDCKIVQGLRFWVSHLGRGSCAYWSDALGQAGLLS